MPGMGWSGLPEEGEGYPKERAFSAWGLLYTADGEVLVARAACIVYFSGPHELYLGDWWGALRPMRVYIPLVLGQEYRLVLNDGRRGQISILRLEGSGQRPSLFGGRGVLSQGSEGVDSPSA